MIYTELSPKQLKSMLWWAWDGTQNYDAIVCDGSVRSGKTMSMTVGFVLWSMKIFMLKTLHSVERRLTP